MSCWYSEKAPQDDIVISTRIRLARNINGVPFPSKMSPLQIEKIGEDVRKAIVDSNTPYAKSLKCIRMEDIPENERFSMVERHIISREFALKYENRSIILSEDETISIMIGEEDHIRIQVILPGLQLEKAYNIAESIDSLLCASLDLAFDERLGFLTECPTNLGTGLRASVMMHLPALDSVGEIPILADSVSKIGFTVRGMYGEGSKALASLYQISNQITLGISEKTAIDNLKIITGQLAEQERNHRLKMNRIKIEDICMRAVGILKNARILSSGEMLKHLSEIKLGMSIGIVNLNISPIKLIIEGQPYMIMRRFGSMSTEERDIHRAEIIRNAFE